LTAGSWSVARGLVIFDCDGVLVDSEPLACEVLRRAVAELGVRLNAEQVDQHFRGRSLSDCATIVGQMLGRAVPERFIEELVRATDEAFVGRLKAVVGVAELLTELRARRVAYCVASSGTLTKVKRSLQLTGLLEFFTESEVVGRLFSAEVVLMGKPAPDLFLHAAQVMGYAPSSCVVIEDSRAGVSAAVAAGMRAFGYAPGAPEYRRELELMGATVVESMGEMSALLLGALSPPR